MQFHRDTVKRDIEQRVMLEQSLTDSSTGNDAPNLLVNDSFLKEELKILTKMKEDAKKEWSSHYRGRK
jgi:hypothetical protein